MSQNIVFSPKKTQKVTKITLFRKNILLFGKMALSLQSN